MGRLSKAKKKEMLKEVNGALAFFVNDGKVINSLKQMQNILTNIDAETFSYHANAEKNDFANWTKDVFGDQKLAKDIAKTKTQNTASKIVLERIQMLEK